MKANYALTLLTQRRDLLQSYIDDTDDVSGLEDWYLRTKGRIRSLDAAIESVRDKSTDRPDVASAALAQLEQAGLDSGEVSVDQSCRTADAEDAVWVQVWIRVPRQRKANA